MKLMFVHFDSENVAPIGEAERAIPETIDAHLEAWKGNNDTLTFVRTEEYQGHQMMVFEAHYPEWEYSPTTRFGLYFDKEAGE